MTATLRDTTPRTTIAAGRERYLTHTDRMMMVVIDFDDGPASEPDPPHQHPHEQITYVAEGELLFIVGETTHHVRAGDMVAVPPNVPHTVQILSPSARLVDAFHPVREDFLQPG